MRQLSKRSLTPSKLLDAFGSLNLSKPSDLQIFFRLWAITQKTQIDPNVLLSPMSDHESDGSLVPSPPSMSASTTSTSIEGVKVIVIREATSSEVSRTSQIVSRSCNFNPWILEVDLIHVREAFNIPSKFELIAPRPGDRSYELCHFFCTSLDTLVAVLRFPLYPFFCWNLEFLKIFSHPSGVKLLVLLGRLCWGVPKAWYLPIVNLSTDLLHCESKGFGLRFAYPVCWVLGCFLPIGLEEILLFFFTKGVACRLDVVH